MDKILENLVNKMLETKATNTGITFSKCVLLNYNDIVNALETRSMKTLIAALSEKGFYVKYNSLEVTLRRIRNNSKKPISAKQDDILPHGKIITSDNQKQVIINQDNKEVNQQKTELPVKPEIPLTHRVKSYSELQAETEKEMAESAKKPSAHALKLLAKMEERDAKKNEQNKTGSN